MREREKEGIEGNGKTNKNREKEKFWGLKKECWERERVRGGRGGKKSSL